MPGKVKEGICVNGFNMIADVEIFPGDDQIMYWSYLCPPESIKVIIIGQDPYHAGQATGLAFSVAKGCQIPPSLKAIYTELNASVPDFSLPAHGCLDTWAKRGVLLLNTILTVEKGKPGSHQDLGWHWFTNYILSTLSEKLNSCVFILWGSKAISKANLISAEKHLILKSQHPSPLAARNQRYGVWPSFIGCNHFNKANEYLISKGKLPIDWKLN
uniref:Uracil-DNA glycosylase n=1 Tax=Sciurus vulgaris TaxID=55149 RepID=A0A8D2CYF3_SCIVU